MTKLLDSKGKLWALMSSKDKAGRIYSGLTAIDGIQ